MSIISNLKSSLSFCSEMLDKYSRLYKEWQHNAINYLNDYCKGVISVNDYCDFIKNYNKVMLRYEYWLSQDCWLRYRLNEEYAKCRH